MTSSYDDSVMNFDLRFLQQTSKNTGVSKLEKQRKAILLVKQKTITTDGLIRKYYNKKEVLEQTDRTLATSKEECKQVCIDYKNVLEKCERLENEVQVIHHYNQQLQQKLSDSENQCCGIQSHARQLEMLVKQQEIQIESLKVEKHLEKSNIKNFATSNSTLQNKYDVLLRDLCILGKLLIGKKLKPQHEAVLQKYQTYFKDDDDSCGDSGGVHSDNELDLFENDLMSPQSTLSLEKDEQKVQSSSVEVQEVIVVNLSSTGKEDISKTNEIDRCSVCSNDIASADTGRGSSLAFSDSEKCFRSPDYSSNDNNSNPEFIRKPINVNSVGTSTIRDTVDIATSPIHFDTQPVPTCTFDKAVSPFKSINSSNSCEVNASQIIINNSIQYEPNNKCSSLQAEECLEVNNSNNYDKEYSKDCEIEMILSQIQFNRDLITPMPSSPCGSHSTVGSRVFGCQTIHDDFIICKDASKLKEENKILHANIADLAKEIMNIKNILKINPLVLPAENINQEEPSKIVEISKSNTTHEINNIVEENLKNPNENDNVNDDLIDMVDLVQICGTENMAFNDFGEMEVREHEQNDEELYEVPIVIVEEEEDNANEGIMSRLEFEDDIARSPIQNTPDNSNDINSNSRKTTANQSSLQILCNYNEKVRRRLRKVNNLEKLRNGMVSKCKIRRGRAHPTRKNRIKKQISKPVKQIRLNTPKKKVTPADSSASLNDKTVYNNAVMIMSELKGKQYDTPSKKSLTPKQTKALHSSETSPKSVKKRLFDVSKLPLEVTEKSFDISDLISKQTPRPVVKSLSVPNAPSEIQTNVSLDKQNMQGLKRMQPIVCIDKILDNTGLEIQHFDKTHDIENINSPQPLSPSVTTRSRSRFVGTSQSLDQEPSASEYDSQVLPKEGRKRLKRASDEKDEIEHKRILRSSTRHSNCENNNTINNTEINNLKSHKVNKSSKNESNSPCNNNLAANKKSAICYDDLNMFDEQEPKRKDPCSDKADHRDLKDSILCTMLEKYARSKKKFQPKKIPDGITNSICKLIEDSIKQINELLPKDTKSAMDSLIYNLQTWNVKQFLSGLMKYLQDPERKVELYSKVNSPPAPPMTKSEQILIYVVFQLRNIWTHVDILHDILSNIEFVMFKLNRTPEFDTVESMSHFYAVLCRYFKIKTRLRLFMLDAMYCMQYKAIALIRQCMDVWMHVLPLAHMGIAKNPLVTCVVYLLHFYKCEDHFNRVQDIRNILCRKYMYQMSEWNETKILEMFRNSIYELRDIPIDKKMLRLSLIILAKRQGPRWCQKNIITNMLQPIIENKDSPALLRQFCVSMIGPLVKPFPMDMKIHCEIVMNLLLDLRLQNCSQSMEEAILTSLTYISKHNQNRVVGALLSWYPKQLSSECEETLRDFVREKPANAWKSILSRVDISAETLNRTEDQ